MNPPSALTWIIPVAGGLCVSAVVTIGVIVILVITLGPLLRNARMAQQVKQTGIDATATIVRTWDTGMRINDNPRVGMLLQVEPPFGAPFQAEVSQTVSIVQLASYQPGAQLQVKYDPATPSRVAIVGVAAGGMLGGAAGGVPAAGMLNSQQAEQMLKQYDAANEQLIKTGLQATAKVLQYMPIGIDVNGNNPAVNLMLEVHPVSRQNFTSQAQGVVISEASVPKYQPGQMITVRYNPNDLTKVAVEHSGV